MSNSIFCSWQSDLPNNTNRGFIRDCLDRAIKAINLDLELDEVLRSEDGVKGVSGTPDVANRIFERVDSCAIFVADISIIGEVPSRRRVPNPNVMIEYGRATKSIGDERILTVFNERFGDCEKDRPFDLRHKLRPICYSLAEDHSKDEKRDARAALTKLLEGSIREIIEAERPEEAGADVEFDAEAEALNEAWV